MGSIRENVARSVTRSVEEDVTKILVNYDYYFERWLEVYGFMERFTNNFLSIDQRWRT